MAVLLALRHQGIEAMLAQKLVKRAEQRLGDGHRHAAPADDDPFKDRIRPGMIGPRIFNVIVTMPLIRDRPDKPPARSSGANILSIRGASGTGGWIGDAFS